MLKAINRLLSLAGTWPPGARAREMREREALFAKNASSLKQLFRSKAPNQVGFELATPAAVAEYSEHGRYAVIYHDQFTKNGFRDVALCLKELDGRETASLSDAEVETVARILGGRSRVVEMIVLDGILYLTPDSIAGAMGIGRERQNSAEVAHKTLARVRDPSGLRG
jgi:hypothetical protein